MLDVKHEEILQSWENRIAAGAEYDAWKDESPAWGLNQADTSGQRLIPEVLIEESRKELEKLRNIRETIRQIAC